VTSRVFRSRQPRGLEIAPISLFSLWLLQVCASLRNSRLDYDRSWYPLDLSLSLSLSPSLGCARKILFLDGGRIINCLRAVWFALLTANPHAAFAEGRFIFGSLGETQSSFCYAEKRVKVSFAERLSNNGRLAVSNFIVDHRSLRSNDERFALLVSRLASDTFL